MKSIFYTLAIVVFFSACTLTQAPKTIIVGENNTSKKDFSKDSLSKLAIIIPEKTIKSYSSTIINASFAYLLRQNAKIDTKVFLIGIEDEARINRVLAELEAENFRFVIAGFTLKGANILAKHSNDMMFFIPTLHKKNTNIDAKNIYFGRIDYDAQIDKLLSEVNSNNIASFYDNSVLSNTLHQSILKKVPNARTYKIEGEKINFASVLKSKGPLRGSSIFLNTPLVTSAIISSQLRVNDIEVQNILSTQIGYNPMLLSLTQKEDRAKLIIANSIANKDKTLAYLNENFSQSIEYNWLAYATSVGLNFFYTSFMDKRSSSLFSESIEDTQVVYDIKLMKALEFNFAEY
ncbi:hypothetical protein CQA38_04730 [Campylobacter sp. MIT 12-5580]|uniref:hypothetical protein n=1 Tax=Campylobacter sp. MIT 12-5580 TaxID=2040651 RepID=UPI0010F5A550|nr:hypothetical protein [Campylobacter sp. MIT 12-5580]TKX29390.1 hypothetical protein CQA38_04730 [Campylobacter sp. MIT 12-5580]